ncbi:hypothetical protein ACFL6M_04415 [Candidatus Eisenbacteria bacterium]|uniref:Uncharacterized protein n=1 Tax=Eiseniibacteriota bacterium TaxID=2212470 RepID=A0ABV6YKX7_UNCEI
MDKEDSKCTKREHPKSSNPKKNLPCYETPKLVTFREDDILEEMGPAQACTSPCPSP